VVANVLERRLEEPVSLPLVFAALAVVIPCEGAGLTALREVRVHSTVLGRAQSQLLPLTPAPAVRCSRVAGEAGPRPQQA